jgi:hypothetical protein
MTLSDLAAWGNFIGGVAVVISFGFLAFQLRQSTHNQRTSIAIQRTALTQELSLSIFARDLPIWTRGNAADPSLTDEEIGRYQGIVLFTLWLYEEHFYQHRDGMLDPGRWATNINRLRAFMTQPGYRAAWRALSPVYFEADFKASVEEILHATPVSTDSNAFVNGWKALVADELAKAAPLPGPVELAS